MSYADYFTGHLRLTILLILTEAPQYSANDSILCQAAEGMGLPTTRDRVRTELTWLEEQCLVSLQKPAPGVTVARLTERGRDVATGMAANEGVQKPGPKG